MTMKQEKKRIYLRAALALAALLLVLLALDNLSFVPSMLLTVLRIILHPFQPYTTSPNRAYWMMRSAISPSISQVSTSPLLTAP